jgi:murein DD-endopeptidase MepM/ murein hydrolase activator NlpD
VYVVLKIFNTKITVKIISKTGYLLKVIKFTIKFILINYQNIFFRVFLLIEHEDFVMLIGQISPYTKSKIRTASKAVIGSIMLFAPMTLGQDCFPKPTKAFQAVQQQASLVDGLKTLDYQNDKGGFAYSYNDSSLEVLRTRMLNKHAKPTYSLPLDSQLKPYVGDNGHFGSPRPLGRPHLGVDIYASLYGRKPKTPIPIHSVVEGIVVYSKKANDNDNKEPNLVKVMGYDGRVYGYNHMAKASDYKNYKPVAVPKLGTFVSTKDTLGYVGATGETDVWHLHFTVNDLDAKKHQQKNPIWQKLYKKYKGYATPLGQVDPLDSIKGGPVAKILHKYRIDKGPIMALIKKL